MNLIKMYSLIIDFKAMDFLEKLPSSISKRIFKKIQQTKEDPYRYFSKLVGRDEYKLRVGDYRIIAEINDSSLHILVVYINHRSKVYKKMFMFFFISSLIFLMH